MVLLSITYLALSTKVKLKVLFRSFSVASLDQNSVSW